MADRSHMREIVPDAVLMERELAIAVMVDFYRAHNAAASRGARSLAPPLSDAVTGRPSGAELANVLVS